ncbi:MAG TPA: TonB-dependent receptor [Rhodothermales bacterium]
MRLITAPLFVLSVLATVPAQAQNWGQLLGSVTDASDSTPLPGVTVVVDGTNYGTATEANGSYLLRLPEGDYRIRFTSVGYAPHVDSVRIREDVPARLDVALVASNIELEEITVEGEETSEAGVYRVDPERVRDIPGPFRDVFRSLKVLPGVVSNNELSNQYSVRGGGYNENLIFLNGFEVYLPFRPRQGEQEGLGLVNPDLTRRITFYAGGFPARYGGKLSSALEVEYLEPGADAVSGGAQISLLDAGAHVRGAAGNGRVSWAAGARKARARHFFSTQELKGNYHPDYTDVQGAASFAVTPGLTLEALGIYSQNRFELDPSNRKTYFGTVSADPTRPSDLRSMWIAYSPDSGELDGYDTRFLGARAALQITPALRAEHDIALFDTEETEFYELVGTTVLFQVDPGSGDPGSGEGHLPIGNAREENYADNGVAVSTLTGQGRWMYATSRHGVEAGWMLRRLRFDDRLAEKGIIIGKNLEGETVRLVVDSLYDTATFSESQAGIYAQDAIDLLPTRGRLFATVGARADYFSFNGEWTFSPRLMLSYRHDANTTFVGSAGIYHQIPTYRELRGVPVPGTGILGSLNDEIRSQRSLQFVAGIDRFIPRFRTTVRAEAYWKRLSNLISYEVENVRVEYSGENDAKGYTYGLDLQLQGEFVPGLESWVNYSFMVARERFLDAYVTEHTRGLLPRPTDQRHTFSAYFQDYVPRDKTWKIHLRALFGSGLPYTPPVPGPRLGNIEVQIPGPRASARFTEYKRIDAGVTKEIELFGADNRVPMRMQLTAELLNVFDMINTVAYSWIPGAEGIWHRVPTRLTPRTFNVRLRVDL